MTPDQIEAEAQELDREGKAAQARGDIKAAAIAFLQAEMRRATIAEMARIGKAALAKRSDVVQDDAMDVSALSRRTMSQERAKRAAHNALLKAIAASPWRSARNYCAKQLRKMSPGSLTNYMDGTSPCPAWVDKQVRKDFPALTWTWKKGIAD